MKHLSAVLCLSLAVLLGSAGMSWSADFQKGLTAAQSGDYASALREWKPLAKQGNALAQYYLGWMYTNGEGVPQNYKTAVKWYRLAAEQGDIDAEYNLGDMYQNGKGVPQNYERAWKRYRRAAEQGHKGARFNLGELYRKGQGVLQNHKIALKWYRLAAAQGNADARTALLRPELQVIIKESERLAVIERERQRVAVINAKIQKIFNRLKPNCTAFGFKEGSSELSNCLFELYKIEQQKEQIRAAAAEQARRYESAIDARRAEAAEQARQYKSAIDARNANAAARASQIETQTLVRQQLQEQRNQRQLESSLELMKRGLEMMNPPKPKLTCKYNTITKTTVCN